MLSSSVRSIGRLGKRVIGETQLVYYSLSSTAQYHSYPSPDEKPQVSTFTSTVSKQIDKSSNLFALDAKFKMDALFPGISLGKPIRDSTTPQTVTSKLANGLTVATQEMPGLMTSLAFVVKTGR